jgi:hypothetical protein
MQEMDAFKVESKIADDTRARAIGMKTGGNLSLYAHVIEEENNIWEIRSMRGIPRNSNVIFMVTLLFLQNPESPYHDPFLWL